MAHNDGLWTPDKWSNRAEEARARAEEMNDPEARTMMLRIADQYDLLSERVGRLEREGRPLAKRDGNQLS